MAETEIATKPATQESAPELTPFAKEAHSRGYRTKEELLEFAKLLAHETLMDLADPDSPNTTVPDPWPKLPRAPFKQPKSWEYWKSVARQSEQEARAKNDKGSQ